MFNRIAIRRKLFVPLAGMLALLAGAGPGRADDRKPPRTRDAILQKAIDDAKDLAGSLPKPEALGKDWKLAWDLPKNPKFVAIPQEMYWKRLFDQQDQFFLPGMTDAEAQAAGDGILKMALGGAKGQVP